MNLELLEHFGQNYPEEFDGALDSISLAVTCCFNRRGTSLAVGCNDGRIVIWDFLTRGMAKIMSAHVHPVCSLSWSRNGHKLVSASTDNTVCVWDVLTSECVMRWRFFSPILKVQFNPRNDKIILICPLKHAAIVVFFSTNKEGTSKSHVCVPLDDETDLNIVASFDRRGQYIYSGNAKGRILVVKLGQTISSLTVMASFRVSNTAVKQIEFAPRRKDIFLVSTADRVIRVYETEEVLCCGKNGEPEPIQKLQDLVNKTMWKKCCFSGGPDADYICAGSARQHALYIWERNVGNLVKILHGTKGELLLDVVWHPIRPIIASISSGVVSVWAQAQVENWSAFAPDFKELDENVEYEERESEFDVEDEDRTPARVTHDNDDEEEIVDVVTPHSISIFLSSDEEEDDQNALIYLPIAPDIDEPEIEGPSTTPTTHTYPETTTKSKRLKTVDIDLKEAPKDEAHPLLSGSGKQQRSFTGSLDKSALSKTKGPPRPTGKRAANGSSTDLTPSKRTKTKKSSEYYHSSSHY